MLKWTAVLAVAAVLGIAIWTTVNRGQDRAATERSAVDEPVREKRNPGNGTSLTAREGARAEPKESAAAVAGRVLDGFGQPIEGVMVWAQRERVTTDANGRFVLTKRPGNTVFLHQDFRARRLDIDADTPDLGDITLRPGETLSGRVEDERGQPAAGLRLSLRHETRAAGRILPADERGWYLAEVTTGAAGNFAVHGLARGAFILATRDKNLSLVPFKADAGRTGVVITVRRAGALHGRVMDAGRPVAEAWVEVVLEFERNNRPFGYNHWQGRTKSDGRFSVTDIPRGRTVHVRIRAPGYLPLLSEDVSIDGATVDYVLDPGGIVAGTVRDENGGPIRAVYVTTTGGAAVTDADGRFRIAGLAQKEIVLTAGEGAVIVQAGSRNAAIVLDRSRILEARALKRNGEPVSMGGTRIAVRLIDANGKIAHKLTHSMWQGWFSIPGVNPGAYTLRVKWYGGEDWVELERGNVRPGGDPIIVQP